MGAKFCNYRKNLLFFGYDLLLNKAYKKPLSGQCQRILTEVCIR